MLLFFRFPRIYSVCGLDSVSRAPPARFDEPLSAIPIVGGRRELRLRVALVRIVGLAVVSRVLFLGSFLFRSYFVGCRFVL